MKIVIIGSGGSGKSTLARKLSKILGIETIHLDKYYWQTGWVPTPKPEWIEMQKILVQQENWIMDGNFDSTMDMRLAACDMAIFLDFPRLLCLTRAIKRSLLNFGKTRPDVGSGCPERLDWSFFKWVWDYPLHDRPNVIERLRAHKDHCQIIFLRTPQDVTRFVSELSHRHSNKVQIAA